MAAIKLGRYLQPGEAEAPNNLFSHVEYDGGPKGDFTGQAKARSL